MAQPKTLERLEVVPLLWEICHGAACPMGRALEGTVLGVPQQHLELESEIGLFISVSRGQGQGEK